MVSNLVCSSLDKKWWYEQFTNISPSCSSIFSLIIICINRNHVTAHGIPLANKMADKEKTKEKQLVPEVPKGTMDEWLMLAKGGDEESQVRLGEHLIKLADSDIDREVNGEKGINWLVQASRRGNDDATKILEKCLKTKTGITDSNKEDVQWCVETSSFEKKIRSASKGLFQKLGGAHKEVMSLEEYVSAVKKMTGGDVIEEKLLLAAGKKIGDNISESELAKVLSKKIQGKITLTASEKELQSDEYKKAGLVTKAVRYPRATMTVLFDEVLEWVSKEGSKMAWDLIPTNQIYLLGIFFLYSFISQNLLFLVIPLVVFYVSLGIMLVSTLQMFYKKKKLHDAAALATVLKSYDVGVDMEETKSQYSWNTMTPYLIYFGALPLMILSFSLANKAFIPCAELCILSLALSAICFSALSDSHDMVTLLALICNLLASFPTFFHGFPNIPVVTPLLNLVTGSVFSVELGFGFQINIGIPSASHIIIPFMFILMAAKNSWQGSYRVLIPHLVCYFWWNFMTSLFPFCTWFGLARATVGYLILPMLLPVFLLMMVGFVVYAVFRLFQTELFGKLIVTLLLLAVPVILSQTKALFGKDSDKKFKSVKKIVMVIFGVLALVPLAFIRVPSFKSAGKFEMTWPEYRDLCETGIENHVPNQLLCNHLIGQKVSWQGKLVGAKITKVENSVATLLNSMPGFVADWLRCVYGEEFGDCEAESNTESYRTICMTMKSLGKECHLKNHETYTFQLTVEMEGGIVVSITAGNSFKYIISALEPDDEVLFTAALEDGLGTKAPSFKLKNIQCTSRDLPVMTVLDDEDDEERIIKAVNEGVGVAFNFFWYPLVEYTFGYEPVE